MKKERKVNPTCQTFNDSQSKNPCDDNKESSKLLKVLSTIREFCLKKERKVNATCQAFNDSQSKNPCDDNKESSKLVKVLSTISSKYCQL